MSDHVEMWNDFMALVSARWT